MKKFNNLIYTKFYFKVFFNFSNKVIEKKLLRKIFKNKLQNSKEHKRWAIDERTNDVD